mgnify:CR=1 FL=1
MSPAATVKSPGEAVGWKELLLITDAQVAIKEIIVESYTNGLPKSTVELQIAGIIDSTVFNLPKSIQAEARKALAQNAQKWHWTFMQQMKVHDAELEAKAKAEQIDLMMHAHKSQYTGLQVYNKTYTVRTDDAAMLKVQGTGTPIKSPALDKFRPLLTKDENGIALIDDYQKKVRAAVKELAEDPAGLTRIDKNGKPYKINLRNFAEMRVRYTENLKDVAELKSKGTKLVWTSSHQDASPRCAPWQGRLYSLDGTSGTIDGIKYTPLDEAILGPRGDGNGIINGYNCRHRLTEYIPGQKQPDKLPEDLIKGHYGANTKQREYERTIRNLKVEERMHRKAGNTAMADKLNGQWKKLEKKYEEFSLNHGRPYYPWRTQVTMSEYKTGEPVLPIPKAPLPAAPKATPIPTPTAIPTPSFKPAPPTPPIAQVIPAQQAKAAAQPIIAYRNLTHDEAIRVVNNGDFLSKIAQDEKDAIIQYTASSANINDYLRQNNQGVYKSLPAPTQALIRKRAADLDVLIKKNAVPVNIKVFRGVSLKAMNIPVKPGGIDPDEIKKLIGKTYKDDGIMSTSIQERTAFGFGSGIVLRMKIPAGTNCVFVDPISRYQGEEEIIFGPGSMYRIDGFVQDPQNHTRYIIDATYTGGKKTK